jgi:regulator of sirC expression with transglutaminase-like and TPR domain
MLQGSTQMNITQDTDFEGLDIALLALMASEDVQDQAVLITGLQQLRWLRAAIQPYVTACDLTERRAQLLHAFYHELHFAGDTQHYYSAENCLLDHVLTQRCGLPITLGIVLMHLANSVEIPVRGVCFPGNFLVMFPDDTPVFIDPFTGEEWGREQQSLMLRASLGDLTQMDAKYIKESNQRQILQRLLNITKACMLQARRLPDTLRCTSVLLTMNPDDPYEIRDRGLVYEQLACPQLAANDYSYFIEQRPQDPVATMLKIQLACLDNSVITLH